MHDLVVAGGGLAGCEAAWQAARRGLRVLLLEMRPHLPTPAHRTPDLAELVCSNSLKSERLDAASGVLKAELEIADSLLLSAARAARVPAGSALAVDRAAFSAGVERGLLASGLVTIERRELRSIEALEGATAVLATGPLTSASLAHSISGQTGSDFLYFYDAISPVFLAESIDLERTFRASRYDKGDADYLNCPLTRQEYYAFHEALLGGEIYPGHAFERQNFFQGCMPIEVMARQGPDTVAHGPLRPVGLIDPRTGRRPFAVVQLRAETREESLWSAVGFQTRLRHGEQQRIFRLIPALARAEFARYGSVHRNTYVCAPRVLRPTMQLAAREELFLAGTLVGGEGYVEAVATGLLAGVNAARRLRGQPLVVPPPESMLGALVRHVVEAPAENFQPMNVNFGLLPPLVTRQRSARGRKEAMAERARTSFAAWWASEGVACARAAW